MKYLIPLALVAGVIGYTLPTLLPWWVALPIALCSGWAIGNFAWELNNRRKQ